MKSLEPHAQAGRLRSSLGRHVLGSPRRIGLGLALLAAMGLTYWASQRILSGESAEGLATAQTTEFSFEYPASWSVLSGPEEALPFRIDGVVGTGQWHLNCSPAAGACGTDNVDVTDGHVVVKLYRLINGPPQPCRGDFGADQTFGANAVRVTTRGSTVTWEIPAPGAEFGQIGRASCRERV